jgi:hypothetical protein
MLLERLAVPDIAISDRWSGRAAQRIARFVTLGGDHEALVDFLEALYGRILSVKDRVSPVAKEGVDSLAVSIRTAGADAMDGVERMPAG